MIAARSGRTDITNILLEGEHMDLDIQENVRILHSWHNENTELQTLGTAIYDAPK